MGTLLDEGFAQSTEPLDERGSADHAAQDAERPSRPGLGERIRRRVEHLLVPREAEALAEARTLAQQVADQASERAEADLEKRRAQREHDELAARIGAKLDAERAERQERIEREREERLRRMEERRIETDRARRSARADVHRLQTDRDRLRSDLSRAAAGLYLGTTSEEQVSELEQRLAGIESALRRADLAVRYLS
jgi:hypothetical protein